MRIKNSKLYFIIIGFTVFLSITIVLLFNYMSKTKKSIVSMNYPSDPMARDGSLSLHKVKMTQLNCIKRASKKFQQIDRDINSRLYASFYLLGFPAGNIKDFNYYLSRYPYYNANYDKKRNCYIINTGMIVHNWEDGSKLPDNPIDWVGSLPKCIFLDRECLVKNYLFRVDNGQKLTNTERKNCKPFGPDYKLNHACYLHKDNDLQRTTLSTLNALSRNQKRSLVRAIKDAYRVCPYVELKFKDRVKNKCDNSQ